MKGGRGGKGTQRGGRKGTSGRKEPPPPYVPQTEEWDQDVSLSFCCSFLIVIADFSFRKNGELNFDEVEDDFDAEPTDDFFIGALTSGVENGTIILSEGEDPLGDDNDFNPRGEEDENDEDFFDEEEEIDDDDRKFTSCSSLLRTDYLTAKPRGPVTSTLFVRKKSTAKGKKKAPKATRQSAARTVEEKEDEEDDPTAVYEAKINVHDGAALRQVNINSQESLLDVLSKVAAAMLRNNHEVEMSCEAPWSTKIGTKKIPQYITNATELEEFWFNFRSRAKKTKCSDIPGILFRNMRDNNVSFCLALAYSNSSLSPISQNRRRRRRKTLPVVKKRAARPSTQGHLQKRRSRKQPLLFRLVCDASASTVVAFAT